MFSFLTKNPYPVIPKFENYKEQSKKCVESQTKAFTSLQDWSANGNNVAIKDVSTKLSILFTKFDEDIHSEKLNSMNEIIQLFEKFKEYDMKISKMCHEIQNAEKLEKKREDELNKCPNTKNIRDFEARLYRARLEKDKLQLKYYNLCNETDAAKSILYKTTFTRYTESMLKYNDAERCILEGMKQLVNAIPDICDDDISKLNYSSYTSTTNICNETCTRMNDSIRVTQPPPSQFPTPPPTYVSSSTSESFQRSSRLSKYKKVKPRKSCPPYMTTTPSVPRLYPCLEQLDSHPKYNSTSNCLTIPSAPPKSDSDFSPTRSTATYMDIPNHAQVN